jgi:hypothetical protein
LYFLILELARSRGENKERVCKYNGKFYYGYKMKNTKDISDTIKNIAYLLINIKVYQKVMEWIKKRIISHMVDIK